MGDEKPEITIAPAELEAAVREIGARQRGLPVAMVEKALIAAWKVRIA